MLQIAGLFTYPIKSVAGLSLDASEVTGRGLAHDRRYMVTNPDGVFITAREEPRLLAITASVQEDGLVLSAAGMPDCVVAQPEAADRASVRVWKDDVAALPVGGGSGPWLSEVIGQPAQLVYMDEGARRPIQQAPNAEVSFADAYPLLIISEASLLDLSQRAEETLDMRRFRPNLVIAGAERFEEDTWQRIRIGAVELAMAGPCERCVLTTRDPDTGDKHPRSEPLRTLATYRRNAAGKVIFGQNALVHTGGTIAVGADIEVLA